MSAPLSSRIDKPGSGPSAGADQASLGHANLDSPKRPDGEDPAETLVDRRYRVRREIARGGAGIIYEAEHVFTGRRIALKMLRTRYRQNPTFQQRLLREARALETARHRGVVALLDAGTVPEHGPYLALELLEGRSLDGILTSRGTLPVADVARLGFQLCDALALAHDRGVVHRDVKPSNLYVAKSEIGSETIKLIDFGIARAAPERAESWSGERLTRHDEIIGTPEYMAPERLQSEGTDDHRADLYSVGVTLYECLVGCVPFEGTYAQVLLKATTQSPRPPHEIRPEITEALSEVILAAIAKNASHRFDNARAFAAALMAATGNVSGSTQLLGMPARAGAPPAEHLGAFPATPDNQPVPPTRRRYARAPYVTPVRIVLPTGELLDGRSEDISEGGLLVSTPRPCNNEERVEVRFALPMTGKILRLAVISRWVRAARRSGAVGLEFLDLPLDARQVIATYVRAMGGV